ncbi:hypothetical protein QTH89_13765 [Variovorax sp. J22G21]|uniref:hypothetical protein n=1 Tax=Variovorax fucosicus TaxID=3053517 RepID=UPI002579108F|nr:MULTISPECIES: hypothetical protein [unclassified Variovorax]MDM0037487.1 hypothetical protein [Variovorax sp. J22R193]MDM0056850.1 hypothetical protein [Variovorax sp. J22G47]MDM0062263.1 hypothetical protein [Variovorax sp. J22G21]
MLFHLFAHDNHSWMVGSTDRIHPESGCPVCPKCGYRIDRDFTARNFSLRQKRYDISCCYDGAVIVSTRFKELCASMGADRLAFTSLEANPGFFHLKCTDPVALDYDAMGTARTRFCPECGIFRDFTGYGRIVLLGDPTISATELVFSDGRFGSNNESIPLLIAGGEFASAFKAAQFKGIASCEPINA